MNIVISPLDAFYIAGAIALLAVALIAYPTLRSRGKR